MNFSLKLSAKSAVIIAGLVVFVVMPLLLYVLGEFPRRSILKEVFSIITVLAFSLFIAQFFLTRSNLTIMALFKGPKVQNVHKKIAYFALAVIFFHPLLIIIPRFFESGVKPLEAFWINITTFSSLGIIVGEIAWVLMLVIGVISIWRMRLIKKYKIKYKNWRSLHSALTFIFICLATWHSVDLGRHVELPMAILFIFLALIGIAMLAQIYFSSSVKTPTKTNT